MRDIATAERAASMVHTRVTGPAGRGYPATQRWLDELESELRSDDALRAYRIMRAWLQLVRELLPAREAVDLGICLPVPLRGLYYEGWDPARQPVRCDRETFVGRFAIIARIANVEVPPAARAAWSVFRRNLPGRAAIVWPRLSEDMRRLLAGR